MLVNTSPGLTYLTRGGLVAAAGGLEAAGGAGALGVVPVLDSSLGMEGLRGCFFGCTLTSCVSSSSSSTLRLIIYALFYVHSLLQI